MTPENCLLSLLKLRILKRIFCLWKHLLLKHFRKSAEFYRNLVHLGRWPSTVISIKEQNKKTTYMCVSPHAGGTGLIFQYIFYNVKTFKTITHCDTVSWKKCPMCNSCKNTGLVTHTCKAGKWVQEKAGTVTSEDVTDPAEWKDPFCNACFENPLKITSEPGLSLICTVDKEPELTDDKYTVSNFIILHLPYTFSRCVNLQSLFFMLIFSDQGGSLQYVLRRYFHSSHILRSRRWKMEGRFWCSGRILLLEPAHTSLIFELLMIRYISGS